MMNNGTRYAGMSTSGNCAIGAVVTFPTRPATNPELSAPVPTATMRSKIPRRFQTTKRRLATKVGRRIRASATHGAVTPIAISPNPAGQANRPGRTPCASRARKPNPPALQAWIAVKSRRSAARIDARNAFHPKYAATNTTKGTVAPIRIGMGGASGGRTNAPFAPRRKTSPNQMARTPTINNLHGAPRRIANMCSRLILLGQLAGRLRRFA